MVLGRSFFRILLPDLPVELSCSRPLALLELAEVGAELLFFGCGGAAASVSIIGALVGIIWRDASGLSDIRTGKPRPKRLVIDRAESNNPRKPHLLPRGVSGARENSAASLHSGKFPLMG